VHHQHPVGQGQDLGQLRGDEEDRHPALGQGPLRRSLRIKAAGREQTVHNLCGGHQQKVVIAQWLATRPRILILDEPTRGIDAAAMDEVHRIISDLAALGSSGRQAIPCATASRRPWTWTSHPSSSTLPPRCRARRREALPSSWKLLSEVGLEWDLRSLLRIPRGFFC